MSATLSSEEIARLGIERYSRDIQARVEAEHTGQFLVLDVLTGDYEIDDDDLTASDQLLKSHPTAFLYCVRIRHPAAYRIGIALTQGVE